MSRHSSRFIIELSDEDREFLLDTWKHHALHAARVRAHAIILSSQGKSATELMSVLLVDEDTVRNWLTRWELHGRNGLEDAPRPGAPPKLNDEERRLAVELLHEHPNDPGAVQREIEARTGKKISRRTLNRIARKARMRWKRLRKSLKSIRDPKLFQQAQAELGELAKMPDIKLAYFDESTFSLTGVVPYGWQDIGERVDIDLSGARKSVHALAVEDEHRTTTYLHQGSIKGDTIVDVLDDYSRHLRKTTVLVLDNASPHTCKTVQSHIEQWEGRGLVLYPLPAYSPELNKIELLWKEIKYTRLPSSAWNNIKSLCESLTNAFKQLGRVVLMPSFAAT